MRAFDEVEPPVATLTAQNEEAHGQISQLAGGNLAQQSPLLVRMFLGIVDDQEQPGAPQRDDDRIVRANKAGGPALGAQGLRELGREPALADTAGAGQETDAGVAALSRPLQQRVFVLVAADQ